MSSAGPSSPTTADTSPRFSFSEKVALSPQSSEEAHSCHHGSCPPTVTTVRPPDLIGPGLCPPEDQGTFGNLSPPEYPAPATAAPGLPPALGPSILGLSSLGLPALEEQPEHGHEEEPEEGPGAPATPGRESAAEPCPGRTLPRSPLAELPLAPIESYCCLPGSLPALPELRESGSEAGSSAQTPQSPEVPSEEFFDTQESVEDWREGPGGLSHSGTPVEVSAPHAAEP